jgi:hypothetical protein
MKKILSVFLLFIAYNASAQFEDLVGKFDVHAGYSAPLGKNYPINGGLSINAEPKVWYNEELVFGAKLGFNFLSSPVKEVKRAPLTSIMLVGEKYMGEGDFQFFIGASAGLYLGGQTKKISGVPTGLRAAQAWGIAPRAGIQYGQYRLMAEYNMRKNDAKFLSVLIGYTFGSE